MPLPEPSGVGTEYPVAAANRKKDRAPKTPWPARTDTWYCHHPVPGRDRPRPLPGEPPPPVQAEEQEVLEALLGKGGQRERAAEALA